MTKPRRLRLVCLMEEMNVESRARAWRGSTYHSNLGKQNRCSYQSPLCWYSSHSTLICPSLRGNPCGTHYTVEGSGFDRLQISTGSRRQRLSGSADLSKSAHTHFVLGTYTLLRVVIGKATNVRFLWTFSFSKLRLYLLQQDPELRSWFT